MKRIHVHREDRDYIDSLAREIKRKRYIINLLHNTRDFIEAAEVLEKKRYDEGTAFFYLLRITLELCMKFILCAKYHYTPSMIAGMNHNLTSLYTALEEYGEVTANSYDDVLSVFEVWDVSSLRYAPEKSLVRVPRPDKRRLHDFIEELFLIAQEIIDNEPGYQFDYLIPGPGRRKKIRDAPIGRLPTTQEDLRDHVFPISLGSYHRDQGQ
jgi:hypothetical protein